MTPFQAGSLYQKRYSDQDLDSKYIFIEKIASNIIYHVYGIYWLHVWEVILLPHPAASCEGIPQPDHPNKELKEE